MNNRAHSSAIEFLQSTDCLLKQLPDPSISKESPHKRLIRLIFGGHHSGIKIAEEETGNNPYCSAAAAGDSPGKQSLEWTSAVLQQRGQTVRRKTKKQK